MILSNDGCNAYDVKKKKKKRKKERKGINTNGKFI
jgi:hypothetical protein